MEIGRTNACARFWHFLAASAILIPAVVSPLFTSEAGAAEYDFILVEAFNENYDLREVIMRDVSEHGVALGTSTNGGYYDGFIWTEESDKTIVPLTWPMGMNDVDQIVGGSLIYNYVTGQQTVVPPAGGYPRTQLTGINNSGIAVGYAECTCSNSDGLIQNDLFWVPGVGSRTTGIPGAKELLRVNNSNVAAGNIRTGGGHWEGYVYDIDAGTHINFSDLLPQSPYGRGYSEADDISENGLVAGRGYDGSYVRGIVWSETAGFRFMSALNGGDPERVYPRGINSSGKAVGFAYDPTGNPKAFLWDEQHGIRNLNGLIQGAPSGFILDWALKISDAGWIVGIGHYGPSWGTSRGFVLKPLFAAGTPETEIAPGLDLAVSPNPMIGQAVLSYAIPVEGSAELAVFDAAGRLLDRLYEGAASPGPHSVEWRAADRGLPSGTYFLRLRANGRETTRRFCMIR